MSERCIVIRPEPFGSGFDITVVPVPDWTSFDCERPTHGAARRYADALKTVYPGWHIVDETGERP